ncbi:KilA-N domain-containing protein [bacterium]|nr:KilA-N domain-containing protein [bacterium]
MNIEAALAHCQRDANGLLKLGGLWLNASRAHSSLSRLVRRHALEATVVKGWAKNRGIYAQERVARKLAQLIPAQHLWRDGGSETTGELRQPVEAAAATTNAATEEISPADTSDSGAPEQNSGVTEPTLLGDTSITTRAFNGLVIERRACDGYFNGTSMCTAFKKLFTGYLRNDRTSEYLDALAAQSQVRSTPSQENKL